MNESETEKKRFSLVKRAKSFTHAWRGLGVFIRSTHNAWLHIAILVAAVVLGFILDITPSEWTALIGAAALVLTAEAFNTAIEIDMNLTSPDYHPHARDTKDVAAGAVLLSAIAAAIIGAVIFSRHII